MQTNNLVSKKPGDTLTVKVPYYVCFEDNWIAMEADDLVIGTPKDALTVKSEPCCNSPSHSMYGEYIEPDIKLEPESCSEPEIKVEPSEPEIAAPGTSLNHQLNVKETVLAINNPAEEPMVKTEPLPHEPDPLATTTSPSCHPELSEGTNPLEAESINPDSPQNQVWHQHQSNSGSIGNMIINIKETGICKRSLFTGWHVMRARGLMMMVIKSKHLGLKSIIRLSIKRQHPDFSSFPIDRVCQKHQADVPFDPNHVLQPGPNENNWIFESSGSHKSIVYFLNKDQSSKKVEIRIMCSDTCRTSTDVNFEPREISRDLVLEVTVENKSSKTILEQETIRIWTKAAVKPSDLNKSVRRESKGSLAIQKKRERLLIEKNPQVTT